MSSVVAVSPPPHSEPQDHSNYLTTNFGWKSWLFTVDHNRIAADFSPC
jgi:hypothetical protein